MSADVEEALAASQVAASIAGKAGTLLLRYFADETLASRWKSDYSIVTEADVAADRLIAGELASHFPGDAILSEELAPTSEVARPGLAPRTWVVDPLDGTTNFSLGIQHWGVSIARCDEKGPDVGVLYFPALGELYVASRGGGATMNGAPIRVRVPSASRPSGMLACCARTPRLYHVNLPMKVRVFGSAAYTLVCVARGSAALGMETRPRLWDLAAGWCVVEEAGGIVETIDGSRPFPLVADRAYADRSFPIVAAASPGLLEQAREHIEER
ncbi:MAG: inositol monophosphatase [Candidatus Binatia bacterium]